MSYKKNSQGFYSVPLVDFGNRLQDNFGLRVVEHPDFGGVTAVHSPNSYHKVGQAIDIQDWRPDVIDDVHWTKRTSNLRDLLRGAGVEVIGPGDMKGHDTHLHLAAKDGLLNLNQSQYDYFFGGNAGGKSSTFGGGLPTPVKSETGSTTSSDYPSGIKYAFMDSGSDVATPDTDRGIIENRTQAAERIKAYQDLSKSQLDAEYDKLRAADANTAAIAGMEMHKAYFNK